MSESRYSPVKAYKNESFLNSQDARVLRILAEYLEPESRFEEFRVKDTIVFFGSARLLPREVAEQRLEETKSAGGDVERAEIALKMSRYYEDTRELVPTASPNGPRASRDPEPPVRRLLRRRARGSWRPPTSGASEAKGDNIGLCISLPFEAERATAYITRRLAFEFHYFFMRKFWFSYLAKAMIIMPGGFGTLDEFMEVVTLVQTQKIKKKMPIVLFGTEYWDSILNFEPMAKFGTISPDDVDLFFRTDSVDEAYEYLTRELAEHALGAAEEPAKA